MDVNKINSKETRITLDDVIRRKKEVLKDIRAGQEAMSGCSQRLFAPFFPSSDGESSSVMKKFNVGIAIFDGVMLGMKIIRRFRKLFKKR